MMRPILFCLFICAGLFTGAQGPVKPLLKKATHSNMQYYITLPVAWSSARKWPVLISITDADKKFRENAIQWEKFSQAYPFIIITPVVVSNGNYGSHSSTVYPYSAETWAEIDKSGTCTFDLNGLERVIEDVKKMYNGEEKVYITGLESGAHIVWAMAFMHSEWLYAAAPVSGNFIGRCVEEGKIKISAGIPVHAFYGSNDTMWKYFKAQDEKARNLAIAKGYKDVTITEVKNKGHEPMSDEVLGYFYGLYKERQANK